MAHEIILPLVPNAKRPWVRQILPEPSLNSDYGYDSIFLKGRRNTDNSALVFTLPETDFDIPVQIGNGLTNLGYFCFSPERGGRIRPIKRQQVDNVFAMDSDLHFPRVKACDLKDMFKANRAEAWRSLSAFNRELKKDVAEIDEDNPWQA